LRTVEKLQPKRAFFTHMSHDIMYAPMAARLPAPVQLAYDGLEIPIHPPLPREECAAV
jgi:phosphoribosyl 1,2-cyclic phosphate phosphodiesterase